MSPVEAFLVSLGLVTLAEIGDKTQLLTLVLARRYRRPWPLTAGIFVATLANHLATAALGAWLGLRFSGPWLGWSVAASFFAIAIWAMLPEGAPDEAAAAPRFGVFATTLCAFFLAEIGDRTQIATVALAARFASFLPVVAGTTLGMMAANVPVAFFGPRATGFVPERWVRWGAVALAAALGVAAALRAFHAG
jgi:putative Ca2+/H+ antiporter (TMEM165/GDT1 family)